MSIKKIITGLALLILLSSGIAVASDFNKGIDAYQSGDFKTALAEFTPLAGQGHVGAQLKLALMYYSGEGVLSNNKIAVIWYTKAAEQGDAHAQGLLAFHYLEGEGVEKDTKRSYMWLDLAAYNGNKDAKDAKGFIAETMTPSQITKAEEMSSRCLNSGYTDC